MQDAPDLPVYYYVECDGMVYLVEREGGRLGFPKPDEVPHDVDVQVDMRFDEATVYFCTPRIDHWPRDWVFKDKIPGMTNVEPLVHRAVNMSLVREVCGGVILDADERMLMVKAARGFTKGMWNIPGGFVTYGETPEEAVVREIKEEVGIDIHVERFLGVYSARFSSPYFMRGFMYLCRPLSTELKLQEDEIADATWMPLEEAHDATINPFCRGAIEDYWKSSGESSRTQSHSTTS